MGFSHLFDHRTPEQTKKAALPCFPASLLPCFPVFLLPAFLLPAYKKRTRRGGFS